MAVVLCAGSDRTLMQTRAMILESGGHTVITAAGERELVDACSKTTFDVAVIGQAVSPLEKQRALGLIRQYCPKAKVLELFIPATGKMLRDADDWLEAPVNPPHDLVERVSTLATKTS